MCAFPHLVPSQAGSAWHPSSAHIGIFPSSLHLLLLLRRRRPSDRTRSSAHPPIPSAPVMAVMMMMMMVVHHPRRRRGQAMSPFENVLRRRLLVLPVSATAAAS
jgi:hypothetical protein